jgi:hypothetical protein
MLVAMKVISIAFDADFGALQCLPSPAEFTGYVLCVGTCVFGPWVPYRDYISIFNKPLWVSTSPTIWGALNLIVLKAVSKISSCCNIPLIIHSEILIICCQVEAYHYVVLNLHVLKAVL